MTRDELIEALLVERYTSPWWTTTQPAPQPDNDLNCARRRRDLAADFAAHDHPERAAR